MKKDNSRDGQAPGKRPDKQALPGLQLQHELAENLINSSFDGILAFDRECRYTIWNRGMEIISGMPAAQVLGKVAFEIFPFLEESGEDRFLYEALSGQAVVAKDRQFIVPESGHGGFFEAHYAPLCNASGDVIGGLAVIHDITERNKAEQALRDSESKYRLLVEHASDGIALYDGRGKIVEVNVVACEMGGYEREEILGMNVSDLIDPNDLAATPLRWEELQDGKAVIGERILLRKDGTKLSVELSARMLSDGRVQTILRDITKRKQAEEEIRRLNTDLERRVLARTAQLEAANNELRKEIAERKRLEAQKDEFVAVASHELRTPISVIKGYTKMALRTVTESGDQRLARNLRIVDEKADQLTRLINDMLDVSLVESNNIPLQNERFDIVTLVKSAVSTAEVTTPEFAFLLEAPGEPAYVYADRQRIEQVIANFIENAVRYTGKHADSSRQIEVVVSLEPGEVVTLVRDYGVGIPAGQQDKVFGRFFRGDNVTNARYPYPGMGLGLFICHDIIQRHRGRIWVESIEGEGSTFYFALPLAEPNS